jgi:hypothetical protein
MATADARRAAPTPAARERPDEAGGLGPGGRAVPTALLLGLVACTLMLTGITAPVLAAHPAFAASGLVVGLAGLVVVLVARAAMGLPGGSGSTTPNAPADQERAVPLDPQPDLHRHGRGLRRRHADGSRLRAVLAQACLMVAVQIQVRVVEGALPARLGTHSADHREGPNEHRCVTSTGARPRSRRRSRNSGLYRLAGQALTLGLGDASGVAETRFLARSRAPEAGGTTSFLGTRSAPGRSIGCAACPRRVTEPGGAPPRRCCRRGP